jgi:AAA-like domain/CHAT domain
MNVISAKKILILAANPKNSTSLRLDREVREIDEGLTRATHRDCFELKQKWAVRPRDVQRAILDLSPQIVHFSGHGLGTEADRQSSQSMRKLSLVPGLSNQPEGLVLEDESGQAKLVGTEALAGLFELFADRVECVVLNACYSDAQARAIAQHIPYVIGMSAAVGDAAACVFAVGFYDALGAGRDIEFAFRSGCVAIGMEGISEELTPVLLKQSEVPQQTQTEVSRTVSLESPEGQVGIESRFYIASPYEERCYEEIKKPGSLIRVKSPHKMGKSSLAARVLAHAAQLGYRTVTIDLEQTNQKFFNDLDLFMQWFCASVGKALGVRVKTEEYWDDIFGANDNSTDYFEKYLLKEDEPPLVLAIDNFDRVFQYTDIETDFCGLLRGWHERSKTKTLWEKLRLLIVHSQESYAQRDINQSPFNVGLPIELSEFTVTQVQDLVARHRLMWSEADLERLTGLIGGHPYMVRVALYYIAAGDFTLEAFLKMAPTEAGVYGDLLRGYLKVLEDCPDLGAAMKKLVDTDGPVSLRTEEAFKLDSMGLVVLVENNVMPRCHLYRQYFRERLGGNG